MESVELKTTETTTTNKPENNASISSSTNISNQNQISGYKRIFKIIVIGDSNVGKTCLTFRFTVSKFLDRSEATIGVDFREKQIQIDNEIIKLQIWDTG